MDFSSKSLHEVIEAFSRLPGIGRKSATRIALYLLRQPSEFLEKFGLSVAELKNKIKFCKECHNLCEGELCGICANPHRDRQCICVVEDIRDVLAIENTSLYNGLYHVLDGILNPAEGTGPEQIHAASLLDRIKQSEIREVIFAFSPTMEGDTTAFYLAKKLMSYPVKITSIARGVPIGGDLEYTDETTLRHSLSARTEFVNGNNR